MTMLINDIDNCTPQWAEGIMDISGNLQYLDPGYYEASDNLQYLDPAPETVFDSVYSMQPLQIPLGFNTNVPQDQLFMEQ